MKRVKRTCAAVLVAGALADPTWANDIQTSLGFDLDPFIFAPVFIDFGLPIPENGQLLESRVTLDFAIDPLANIDNYEMRLHVPSDVGGDAPLIVTEVYDETDFTISNGRMSGTVTTNWNNLHVFPIDPNLGGWSLQITSESGLFEFFGEGSLRGEFDWSVIPEPATLGAALLGFVLVARRR